MRQKKAFNMFDKIFGFVCLVFIGYIAFMAIYEEGWKDGGLILLKIFGAALAATMIGMILVSLVVWAVFVYKRYQRVREIQQEVFTQRVLEHPNKKEGIDMSCDGPNKFAR